MWLNENSPSAGSTVVRLPLSKRSLVQLTLWTSARLICSWIFSANADEVMLPWMATTWRTVLPTLFTSEAPGEYINKCLHRLAREEAAEYIASDGHRLGPYLNNAFAKLQADPAFAERLSLDLAVWIIANE